MMRFLIDVTVRSPFARELCQPHCRPGVAASNGESDKISHYGPAVVPFAIEQFGRLGLMARQALTAMHRESSDYGKLRPGTGRAQAVCLRALRADIEAAVVRSCAQTTLVALGASALPALGWLDGVRGRARRLAGAGE